MGIGVFLTLGHILLKKVALLVDRPYVISLVRILPLSKSHILYYSSIRLMFRVVHHPSSCLSSVVAALLLRANNCNGAQRGSPLLFDRTPG